MDSHPITYYMIREGRPPSSIIVIHRIYDSAVACFQEFINSGVESIDLWGVGTNSRGMVTTERLLIAYTRDEKSLQQPAQAGIHNEHLVTALCIPDDITDTMCDQAKLRLCSP